MAFNDNQFALLGGHADEVANFISRYTAEKQKGREQDLEMQQGNGVDNRHMQNNGAGAIDINVESASKKHEEEKEDESSEGWEVIRRRRRCCSLVRMHFGEIPSNILIHSNDATGIRERNSGWKREKGNRSYSAFKDQQQQSNRVKPAFKDQQQRRGRENGYQSDRVKPAFNDQQRRQRQNGNRSDQVKAAEKSTERENRMRRRSNSGGSITSNGKPDIPVSKGDDAVAHETSRVSNKLNSWKLQEMTLRVYEKQLEEKRKVLESLKSQESRVVALDKDFESMHIIEKNKEESIFIKLNSESDKVMKKNKKKKKALVTNLNK